MSTPAVRDHRRRAPTQLGFASLTVSDSRKSDTDTSGKTIREKVEMAGHRLVRSDLVADEIDEIQAALRSLLGDSAVEVVVVSGGTGFAPRDRTLEAIEPLLERTVPGFGELFRMLSYDQVQAAAMLSRAAAGLVGDRAVFILPGSPKAVALAMDELILPEAAHLISQARRPG